MFLAPILKYVAGGLLFLTLILGIALKVEKAHSHKLERRNAELVELRKADRRSYEAAQAEAARKNAETVHKIEAQNEAITNRVRSDYSRDLDLLRAQARAHPGSPRGSQAPGVPQAAPGTPADGLPATPCDHLCASEIELRLMYLQNWVLDQLKVEPN